MVVVNQRLAHSSAVERSQELLVVELLNRRTVESERGEKDESEVLELQGPQKSTKVLRCFRWNPCVILEV